MIFNTAIAGLVVALAVGLLIGLDRERHKRAEAEAATAGLRTFTLASLLGAIVAVVNSQWMLLVAGAGVVLLIGMSYRRKQRLHPGQTTEFALLATFAIGFLAIDRLELAAGLGVAIALLLNSKSRLHKFAVTQLSEQELHDATLLAGAALIVLPLLPDRAIDPLGVVNLQVAWRLTVLMLVVNALGYIARRMLGAGVGLAVAGFCSGFVSSVLTIASFGRQSRAEPAVMPGAVAGAAFSSIATVVQLLFVIALANPKMLFMLMPGIIAMGAVAALYGLIFVRAARRAGATAQPVTGRAFEPKFAILFSALFALMSLIAALMQRWLGAWGATAAVTLGGFADTHAAAASAARLAAAGTLPMSDAAVAAMLAISANTLVKMAAALLSGGRAYALRLWPSHLAMIAALWGGWLLRSHWS